MDYEVGQKVWFKRNYGGGQELTVGRIGRKYAYLGTGGRREYKVELGTTDVIESDCRIGTVWPSEEAYNASVALQEDWTNFVRQLSVGSPPKGLTSEKLAQLRAILDIGRPL